MWIVLIAISLMFLILGIVFMRGKGAFLIAGYNTSSKEAKAKYDEKLLCRFMGKIMFSFAANLLITAISVLINSVILQWTGIVLFFCVAVFALIYSNTGSRFKK